MQRKQLTTIACCKLGLIRASSCNSWLKKQISWFRFFPQPTLNDVIRQWHQTRIKARKFWRHACAWFHSCILAIWCPPNLHSRCLLPAQIYITSRNRHRRDATKETLAYRGRVQQISPKWPSRRNRTWNSIISQVLILSWLQKVDTLHVSPTCRCAVERKCFLFHFYNTCHFSNGQGQF